MAYTEHCPATCYTSELVKCGQHGTYGSDSGTCGSDSILTPSHAASASMRTQPAGAVNALASKSISLAIVTYFATKCSWLYHLQTWAGADPPETIS